MQQGAPGAFGRKYTHALTPSWRLKDRLLRKVTSRTIVRTSLRRRQVQMALFILLSSMKISKKLLRLEKI